MALAGAVEHGIGYSRRDRHNARFARTSRRGVVVSDQQCVDGRRVVAAGDSVAREPGVEHTTILEIDRLVQRRAHPHDDRTFDLILRSFRVHDESAIERCGHAINSHLLAADVELNGCRDIAAYVDTYRDPLPTTRRALRRLPAVRFCGALKHAPEPRV